MLERGWISSKGCHRDLSLAQFFLIFFINDIFLFVSHSKLYNYADDNTLSYSDSNVDRLKEVLETDSNNTIQWFTDNKMQENLHKFQAITVGEKTHKLDLNFKFDNISVLLLGVTIDFKLNFYTYMSEICKKSSRQLKVLKNIGNMLIQNCRLATYYSKSFKDYIVLC